MKRKTTLVIGSDHRGLNLKHKLCEWLMPTHPDVSSLFLIDTIQDVGAHDEKSVDYPDIVRKFATRKKQHTHGILICGSGFGVSIAANRHKHIRAIVGRSVKDVSMARKHNDANVLCIGADFTGTWRAKRLIRAFFNTEFEGGRHAKRIEKIT